MADPARAVAVASAAVRIASAAGVPVTVKIRSGIEPGDGLGERLAPRLEAEGVAALAVHARAASDYYHGRADHSVTAAVVGAVGIPVLASGDVTSVEQALAVIETTGAAAVMVARGAIGNPWVVGGMLSGASAARPALPVVVADLRTLLGLVAQEEGAERGALWIRKLLTFYLRPSQVPAPTIEAIRALGTAEEVDAALASLI
jgi:tRNA-dihydrouridine synthase B